MNIKNINVLAGIHTLQMNADIINYDRDKTTLPFLSDDPWTYPTREITAFRINPNKYYGCPIPCYSEYQKSKSEILDIMGLSDKAYLRRCDYNFDDYNTPFQTSLKLNRYLIRLMSVHLNVDNVYHIVNDRLILSVSTKFSNDYHEFVAYDKQFESDGRSDVLTRLEFRFKKIKKDLLIVDKERYYFGQLIGNLKASIKPWVIERLEDEMNKALYDNFLYEVRKNNRDLHGFIERHEEYFFTRKQMQKFAVMAIPTGDPVQRINRQIRKNNIEVFSQKDLTEYVDIITRAGNAFFSK